MASETVGIIGLGNMGKPMAKNLIDAGYTVIGYNRSKGPVNDIVEAGGGRAETPAEAARRADVIITCLPDSAVVSEVMRKDDGIMDGLRGGETVIDTSTTSPTTATELSSALGDMGVDMLDAPLSGGESGAIDGSLSIMIGGDADVMGSHSDLLHVLGNTITYCGPSGAGQVTKACNQIVVGNTLEAIGEALVFAEKAGADLEAVVEAISGGAAGCWALENKAPSMIRGDFEPGGMASYQYKDLRIATNAGETFGAPMPITATTQEMYKAMEENDMGDNDHSGIIQIIEMLAGTQARIDE